MANMNESRSKIVFYALWICCLLGSWLLLPYVRYLEIVSPSVSFKKLFLLSTVQSAIFFGLICWGSYSFIRKTDLTPFPTDIPLKRMVWAGAIAGIAVGFIIFLLDTILFKNSLLSGTHPPFWIGLLASFYGGINEEVLLRLFLFTLIYFAFGKLFKLETGNRSVFLWMTNLLVAIAFGMGHLPAALKLVSPSPFEIFRVLLLNGIPGIVFGWLYWSRGLWTAMVAHFVADLVIHAVLI